MYIEESITIIIRIIGFAITSARLRTVTAAVNDYEKNE